MRDDAGDEVRGQECVCRLVAVQSPLPLPNDARGLRTENEAVGLEALLASCFEMPGWSRDQQDTSGPRDFSRGVRVVMMTLRMHEVAMGWRRQWNLLMLSVRTYVHTYELHAIEVLI